MFGWLYKRKQAQDRFKDKSRSAQRDARPTSNNHKEGLLISRPHPTHEEFLSMSDDDRHYEAIKILTDMQMIAKGECRIRTSEDPIDKVRDLPKESNESHTSTKYTNSSSRSEETTEV